MNVDVVVNGRRWKVAVESAEQARQLIVTINGVRRVVDAAWIDPDTLSLIDAGSAHEIRFHPSDSRGAFGVEVGGTVHEAVVPKRSRENPPAPFEAHGSHAVTSPMPGRVVRVLVSVGDRVAARQAVVVVEAMKMENELRSPAAGTVKEIAAVPGAAVETGTVLVVVDQ